MSSSAAWQAWRIACLPYVESLLCRSPPTLHQVPTRSLVRTKRPIRIHHVRFSSAKVPGAAGESDVFEIRKDIRDRKIELDQSGVEQYPRATPRASAQQTVSDFVKDFSHLKEGQLLEKSTVTLKARISSLRKSGGKLAFVDVVEEPGHHKLQLMLNFRHLESVCDQKTFQDCVRLIRRGDIISIDGCPTRTSTGELSLLASSLPKILSPCLHTIPVDTAENDTGELLDKHVQMLANSSTVTTLVARSRLVRTVRDFLEADGFYEVQTPILAADAGGATARPFRTTATEFADKKLALRIAPELWLKRLMIGGMPKVFEIGPSFRNEGLDRTHNPEFTSCEFYAAHYDLNTLQRTTEHLFRQISEALSELDLNGPVPSFFTGEEDGHFAEIDFIPAINAHLQSPLPNLALPTAEAEVLDMLKAQSIPVPAIPTLPRLLDTLCSHFLEPECESPTWITNIPECMSPLAKSFVHPRAPNSQRVAARAELFIQQREVVNCYEEENSPFEQRRKFIEQQRFIRPMSSAANGQKSLQDEEIMKIDEDYLRALEWGLPPTGGWGCGIDRLVMLFTGKDRIGDVLTFGNLRAVARGAEKWKQSDVKTDSGGA